MVVPSPSGLHSCCGDSGKRDGCLSVVGMYPMRKLVEGIAAEISSYVYYRYAHLM